MLVRMVDRATERSRAQSERQRVHAPMRNYGAPAPPAAYSGICQRQMQVSSPPVRASLPSGEMATAPT